MPRREAEPDRGSRRRRVLPTLLSSLDSPEQAVSFVGPNWFASIMGTGIVPTPPLRSPS